MCLRTCSKEKLLSTYIYTHYIHTQTHKYTHARTHIHTHTHTLEHTNTHRHTNIYTNTHTRIMYIYRSCGARRRRRPLVFELLF